MPEKNIWAERAEKWLWDSCGYAPDISVEELAEWMKKAEKYDAWLIDKTDGAIITISQEKWQECLSVLKKLEAVKTWWNMFNQCIDSEAVKDKLEEILEDST